MSKSPRTLSSAATRIIWKAKTVGAADPDPHRIFTDSARGVAVFGVMLEGLSQGSKKAAKWITLGARIAWGIVEVSVPRKPLYRLGRNWLGLLGFLGVGVIVLGLLNPKTGMTNVGVLVLVLTIATWITSYYLGTWMKKGRPTWGRMLMGLVLLALAFLTLLAVNYFAERWPGVEKAVDPKATWIRDHGGAVLLAFKGAATAIVSLVAFLNLLRLARKGDVWWKRVLGTAGMFVVPAVILYLGWRWSGSPVVANAGVEWTGTLKGWWGCLGTCSLPHWGKTK